MQFILNYFTIPDEDYNLLKELIGCNSKYKIVSFLIEKIGADNLRLCIDEFNKTIEMMLEDGFDLSASFIIENKKIVPDVISYYNGKINNKNK